MKLAWPDMDKIEAEILRLSKLKYGGEGCAWTKTTGSFPPPPHDLLNFIERKGSEIIMRDRVPLTQTPITITHPSKNPIQFSK